MYVDVVITTMGENRDGDDGIEEGREWRLLASGMHEEGREWRLASGMQMTWFFYDEL